MCDTCGCENDNEVQILKPGEHQKEHHHHGDHSHEHHHHHDHDEKCSIPTEMEIQKNILGKNELMAAQNRGFFEALKITAFNIVSSPGSGKTSILEKTISENKTSFPFFVIEGDQQTSNDAERIDKTGVPVVQINTGNGCHLDANMVHIACHKLELSQKSFLMIENVGNLVCPSLFDLGEDKRIIIFSVTEGDDKPEKYPTIFHTSDVCIINKIDLLPYVDFDMPKAQHQASRLNPEMIFFEISAKTGEGMEAWYSWLAEQLKQ